MAEATLAVGHAAIVAGLQRCARCGTPLEAPKPAQQYCSRRCKRAASKTRRRERDAATRPPIPAGMEQRTCIGWDCQTVFTVSAGSQKRYCTKKCSKRTWDHNRLLRAKTGEAPPPGEGARIREAPPVAWVPEKGDNTTAAAVRRRELIRELAPQGYTGEQIGAQIKMHPQTVRVLARELGIPIPADQIKGRSRRHDPDRIIRETAQALEGLAMGVALANPADCANPAEARQWATSISESTRTLTRFANQIKEMTQ